jgi:phage internal scaffolding protein
MENTIIRHRTKDSERLDYLPKIFEGVGRTKSEFKESCDINYILKKYLQNGTSPQMKQNPIYGDFSTPIEYQEAQNIIIQATQQFEGLPSDIRNKFANDPSKFLEFTQNPDNTEELNQMIGNEPDLPDPIPPPEPTPNEPPVVPE